MPVVLVKSRAGWSAVLCSCDPVLSTVLHYCCAGATLRLQETLAERKAARRAEREALARGEMPDSLKKWRVSTNHTQAVHAAGKCRQQ